MDKEKTGDLGDLYKALQTVVSDLNSVVKPVTHEDDANYIQKSRLQYLTAASAPNHRRLHKHSSEQVDIKTLILEYEKSNEELQLTLSALRSQRKVLAEDVSKEQDVKDQLMKVKTALAEKVQEQSTRRDPTDSYKLQLENRLESAKKEGKEMRTSLGGFINKHFPLPTPEVVSEAKRKLRSSESSCTENLSSLKSILEDLVNKCMEDPNDPYIDVDNIWPPYLELLSRCQIVTRHPDNNAKIKLVPFHL
jgi:hypothetical protein